MPQTGNKPTTSISPARPARPSRLINRTARVACAWLLLAPAAAWPQDRVPGTNPGTAIGTISGTSRVSGGLLIKVRINQTVWSKNATQGDNWSGVLAQDVIAGGHLLVSSGTQVTGIVSEVDSSTKTLLVGKLTLRLTSIRGIGVNSNDFIQLGKDVTQTSSGSSTSTPPSGAAAPERITVSLVSRTVQAGGAGTSADKAAASDPGSMEARVLNGAILTFTTE